jgi:hypothetical protein
MKILKSRKEIGKYIVGSIAVTCVIGWFCIKTNTDKPKIITVEKELEKGITRPFPEIPIRYESFTIFANETSDTKTANGSSIMIPGNSLVDSMGNPVKGRVEIKYREFRDMVDVFLSGIPMDYDSAGYKKHFESAGMFELLAYQNNKPVFIAKDKSISVAFASTYQGDRFNIYYFNLQNQHWEYMYKDTSKANNQDVTQQIKTISNQIKQLESSIPLKPIKANPKKAMIRLDILETEFPEIAIYGSVGFQLVDDGKVNPAKDTLEWDIVKVVKAEKSNYLLHLERGKETKEFLCIPVFEKADYSNAIKVFEEKHKASLSLIKNKEKEKQDLIEKYKIEKAAQQNSLAKSRLRMLLDGGTISNQEIITRQFSIKHFGIFNSDCPQSLPQGELFALKLVDSADIELDFDKVYLVEKNKNALYTYYKNNVGKFSYNPRSQNLLWTVTTDNKLAVFSYKKFKALEINSKGESKTLLMKVVNVNFKNEAQLRKYLEL